MRILKRSQIINDCMLCRLRIWNEKNKIMLRKNSRHSCDETTFEIEI